MTLITRQQPSQTKNSNEHGSSKSICKQNSPIFVCFKRSSLIRYSKACVKWSLSKRPKNGFQDCLSLNAGQKYCRMLMQYFRPSLSYQLSLRSLLLSTFIKLPFVIKIFVLSIFEWPFYTGFTVLFICLLQEVMYEMEESGFLKIGILFKGLRGRPDCKLHHCDVELWCDHCPAIILC